MTAIALGLAAALVFGVGDLLAVIIVRKVGRLRFLLWSHISGIVLATPFALFVVDLGQVPIFYWMVLASGGLLLLGMLASYLKAVQLAPVALVAPIAATHVVVVILLSMLLLDERLGLVRVAGVALALGGLSLVSIASRGHQTFQRQNVGIAVAVLAMLVAGSFVFFVGVMSRELGWFIVVYYTRLSSLFVIMPIHWIAHTNPLKGLSVRLVAVIGFPGIMFFGGLSLYALALQTGPMSVVVPAFSVYPVVSVLGGILLLRERAAIHQVAGVICVIMGLIVVGATS